MSIWFEIRPPWFDITIFEILKVEFLKFGIEQVQKQADEKDFLNVRPSFVSFIASFHSCLLLTQQPF